MSDAMHDAMHDPVAITPADGPPTRRAIPPPPQRCGPAGWTTADLDPIAEIRDIAIVELVVDGWSALADEITGGRSGTSALRELSDNASPAAELAVRKLADVERLAGVLPTPAPVAGDARAEILAGLAEAERSTPDADADTTPPSDRAADAWDSAIDGIQALAEGILWDARALAQEGHPDATALAMLGYTIRGVGESAYRGIREGIEAWAARMPRRGRQ